MSQEKTTTSAARAAGQNDREFVWEVYHNLSAEAGKLHERAIGRTGEAARVMRREFRRLERRLETLSALVSNDPAHIAAGSLHI